MKKLYAFLFTLIALGVISSEVAQAQSYTINSYLVRKVDGPDAQGFGSGPAWNPLTSPTAFSGTGPYFSLYPGEFDVYSSNGVALPFNVTFADKSLTTTNTFSIGSNGTVILDPSWSATWYEEPLAGECIVEDGYIYGVNSSSNVMYDYYDEDMYENTINDGSIGIYSNYVLMPFSGYMYNYNPYFTSTQTKFGYSVVGSAPNRELVVETDDMHPFEEAFYNTSGPDYGSWQVVIYENAISTFQYNYGPTVGNPRDAAGNAGYSSAGITVNGYTLPGSWCYHYWFNEGSYIYYEIAEAGMCGMKTTAGNCILVDWNGNGWDASKQFVYNHNYHEGSYYGSNSTTDYLTDGTSYTDYNNWMGMRPDTARYLPQSSVRFTIAYPYDFTAGTITVPPSEQPQNLNVALTPTAVLTNSGSQVPTSLQVNFTISEVGIGQVYNQTQTLTGAQLPGSFASKTITFPQFTPGVAQPLPESQGGTGNNGYGIYEDTMIVFGLSPTADQNPSDNESTDEWICSPPNDIKAVVLITPQNLQRTQIGVATPISIRFRNLGTNDQTNVPLVAVVKDQTGAVTFRDTVIVPHWPAGSHGGNSDGTQDYSTDGVGPGIGAYYDTAFPWNPAWTPSSLGTDTVFGIAILGDDQLRADDTTKTITQILPEYDAKAVAVTNPQPGQEEPYLSHWVPAASFSSVGTGDLFDPKLEIKITRCSDNTTVFDADTIVDAIYGDQGNVIFYFPSVQGIYNTSTIPPGCYNICAIAHASGDVNNKNDTACSQFSVIDRLKGDYYVGVGRQFQTIHAAVDSMRFRGIGANVRMILTDASYTENGSTDASSPWGAIDLQGITGLSSSSTVTWIPYPGQTPTITFTGSEPYCFYMGDLFEGYMKFEGYNPATVPSPDKLTPEPSKRGLTIVNNETRAGAVFGLEEGASNITLKDLILHGNGFYTNDSSTVVRIYNEHNQFLYPLVRDTVAMHGLMVNNCELGDAKYGIYDHGEHDQFDAVKGQWVIWRNYGNTITRNTIGTSSAQLSYAGVQINSENGIVISHNEVTNVNTGLAGSTGFGWNAFGIEEPSPAMVINPTWPGDTGNVVGAWIDANRCHILTSRTGNTYGIAIQEAATQYTSGGLTPVTSKLPVVTQNRITNNMLFDLRTGTGGVYPILMNTASSTYSADEDSVFSNSISTNDATANITIQYEKHAFLWDNIFQNTGAGPYTNYWLEVPRPYASSISSDYNLFDLRGTSVFDSVIEYDVRYGTVFQRLYFRRLNDWRSYVGKDTHSLTGDPLFATPAMGTDSLHMPPALTYVESPASNNGLWLGTATQARDFDGDLRLQGNNSPDIGADEFDGFQFTNDLAVLEIVQPAGFSQTSDTSLVTTESPLWINAVVKNLSSVGVYNEKVTATVQQSQWINNGTTPVWVTVATVQSAPLTWQVGEAKNVILQGPALTSRNDTGVFQVVITVPNDQNNANNSQQKAFRILLKQNAVLVSYNGANSNGLQNRDSVTQALTRLGVPYDLIDRNAPNGLASSTIIDYTPWWTIVWSMGDPGVTIDGSGNGQGALSLQETDEVTRYLAAGLSYAKKSMVIAGQNVAYYHGFAFPNNPTGITDSSWLHQTMHTNFVANSPIGTSYNGGINGQQPAFWKYEDFLKVPTNPVNCEECSTPNLDAYLSPDVIKPYLITPQVGPQVNGFAYSYANHNSTPNDSGAGVSYYNNLINTVFYGFDWANPYQTGPNDTSENALTSGTTRTIAAAFAFFTSHQGTVLPVSFVNATVQSAPNASALFQWEVAGQKDVANYRIDQQAGDGWTPVGRPVSAVDGQLNYASTQAGFDPSQTYTFRIAAVDQSGAETYSNTMQLGPDASALSFTLAQSYPNPTAGMTQIAFTLPEPSQITLRVMDVTGKIVNADVTNQSFAAGLQSVKLDLSALPSGSYLYEMIATGADGQTVTLSKKLTIEKE